MHNIEWLQKSLRIVLTLAFISLFCWSLLKLTRNSLATRINVETMEKLDFPSITICPLNYNRTKVNVKTVFDNVTLGGVMNLPKIQDSINVIVDVTDVLFGDK